MQAGTACSVDKALLARRRIGSNNAELADDRRHSGLVHVPVPTASGAPCSTSKPARPATCSRSACARRSASVLANYRRATRSLYLCDLRLDEPAATSRSAPRNRAGEPGAAVGTSADLPAKLDLKAMHQSVRWFHRRRAHRHRGLSRARIRQSHRQYPGHRRGRRLLLAALPANTTEVVRYMEKNPFHFRLLAVGFNKTICAGPRACRVTWISWLGHVGRAARLWRQDHDLQDDGPWDTDAVGITDFRRGCRRHRRSRQRAAALADDAQPPRSPWRHLQNGWRLVRSALKP